MLIVAADKGVIIKILSQFVTFVCWSALKMKVLAIVLLCAFATVQGRSAVQVVDNSSTDVELESKPWVAHLRYAIVTGFLETAVGSLISSRWVLTTSDIDAARYIWIRLNAKKVLQPGMVIESSIVRSRGDLGLINLNRPVTSGSIAPIGLVLSSGAINGHSCGYSVSETGGPGENLQCSEIAVEESEDGKLVGPRGSLSQFDAGTALVNNEGLQSGVLLSVDDTDAIFAVLTNDLADWITEETGVVPSPQPDSSESNPDSSESNPASSESNSASSESNSDSSESEEDSRVKFVN